MKTKLLTSAAFAVLMIPGAAFAQSTGTIDAETESSEVVVTGSRTPATVNGIQSPNTPKARAVITQELIERRTPGQTIFDTINLIPGVNFTNSDPYGSSGGNLRIRGFDGSRISSTFDGLPLNDSGNYSIYTNQQLDPELIEQVNVNFGATDVDSPTASASGGTVNYRSLTPTDKMGATIVASAGTFDMTRVFGQINTGEFTKFGTKMWVAASEQRYDQYRGFGKIYKQQYNFKIYQPLGGSGDFVSLAGHYNQNRNNSYSNPTLANISTVAGTAVVPAITNTTYNSNNPYTLDLSRQQFDAVYRGGGATYLYDYGCALPSASGAIGTPQSDTNACGNVYSTAINPSNTGNLRLNSRFGLTDKLTFTFDGAYQFTRANGGGSAVFAETNAAATNAANVVSGGTTFLPGTTNATGIYNYQLQRLGAGTAAGVDINRDGDTRDNVRVYFPSNTRTQRFTAIAGLRYDLDADNLVRLAYTWDRARHRQTGEASLLTAQGDVNNVFSAFDGKASYAVDDAAGNVLNKRNRLSYAILHQVSGEYRGQFFDNVLGVTLGVRAPFFRRNLNNYCYTIAGQSSDAYCTSQTAAQVAANTTTARYGLPYAHRIKTYNAVLPNVGFTVNATPAASLFGSYSKGFSAPRTDNLYSFDDVKIAPSTDVIPEKTDSFDLGARYTSRLIQAQVAGWYIKYNNRIVTTTTLLEGGGTLSTDRNVGSVKSHGVDASLGIKPDRHFSVYGFGSYTIARLQDNVVNPLNGALIAPTADKFVVETPKWQYGGRAQVNLDVLSGGIEFKHVGRRFVTDINDLAVGGYNLVNADVRVGLEKLGMTNVFLQFNATNLLKERYFGNLSTATNGFAFTPVAGSPATAGGSTRFTFGAPRAFTGSIRMEF
jgi:iron complex outermembrane receptor protein